MQQQNNQTPQRFFKLLEAGDLAFLDFMEYAVVIFGITKHGKTTISHYFTNHLLQAYKNDLDVSFRLKQDFDKKSDAKIGETIHSQTEIPNKFETNIRVGGDKMLYLIDNPGHKDSFGINRVLSNAYFHYRVFSKIQNMKIILVFDFPMFRTVKQTNEIFNIFLKSFENFSSIKNQLLRSIAIVFTKVPNQKSTKDVISTLQQYKSQFINGHFFDEDKIQFIKNLINCCIKQNKITLFRQAVLGVGIKEKGSQVLKSIVDKLQFFSRPIYEEPSKTDKIVQFVIYRSNLPPIKKKNIKENQREKKVQMKMIKFTESSRVLALQQNPKQKRQTELLFEQLKKRGDLLFGALAKVLQKFYLQVFFELGSNQVLPEYEKEQTHNNRHQMLKSILGPLNDQQISKKIKYNDAEKYKTKRQKIIQNYRQSLINIDKANNFIKRLSVASSLFKIIENYQEFTQFANRSLEIIENIQQSVEKIIFKLSQFYTREEEIKLLSQFFYDISTFLNQIHIFHLILSEKASITIDKRLKSFLDCLQNSSKTFRKLNDNILQKFRVQFNIKNKNDYISENSIIENYLKKFPNIIKSQNENEEEILDLLRKTELSLEYRLQTEMLVFRALQKKHYFFIELKSFNETKNMKESEFEEINKLKTLIISWIFYLKSVKKMKQLVEFKEFQQYKKKVYQINFLVWTYLTKLFFALLELQRKAKDHSNQNIPSSQILQLKKDQKEQSYKQIIIQILSTFQNYGLFEEIYEKLLSLYQKKFQQITMNSAFESLSKESQKNYKIYSEASFQYFKKLKMKASEQIIDLALVFAQKMRSMGLKEKSLALCNTALKYVEFCQQELIFIEDMIRKIKIQNSPLIVQEMKSIYLYEASISTRKHLTKFVADNSHIKSFQFAKSLFF